MHFDNKVRFLIVCFAFFGAGCYGSLVRDVNSDYMSAHADPFYSRVTTHERSAINDCIARLNTARDGMLNDYCRVTGGCTPADGVTETTVTMTLADYCAAAPSASTCQSVQAAGGSFGDQSITVTSRGTEHGSRTTGLDSGAAFFASSQMSAQYAQFCQSAAQGLGGMGGFAAAPSSLWSLGAMGMPYASASGMVGFGGMGMGGGMNNVATISNYYPIRSTLPRNVFAQFQITAAANGMPIAQGVVGNISPGVGGMGFVAPTANVPVSVPRGTPITISWACTDATGANPPVTGSVTGPMAIGFDLTASRCGLRPY